MSNFIANYPLDELDLHIPLALPFFFESCEIEIDYSIDKGFWKHTRKDAIDYKSINILSILTEKGLMIPTNKQVDLIVFYLKKSILDEEVEINEICLQGQYEQEKAEWLYETKLNNWGF